MSQTLTSLDQRLTQIDIDLVDEIEKILEANTALRVAEAITHAAERRRQILTPVVERLDRNPVVPVLRPPRREPAAHIVWRMIVAADGDVDRKVVVQAVEKGGWTHWAADAEANRLRRLGYVLRGRRRYVATPAGKVWLASKVGTPKPTEAV
jgi:hypothetical protein